MRSITFSEAVALLAEFKAHGRKGAPDMRSSFRLEEGINRPQLESFDTLDLSAAVVHHQLEVSALAGIEVIDKVLTLRQRHILHIINLAIAGITNDNLRIVAGG